MSDAEALYASSSASAGLPPWKIICKLHFNKKLNLK